ncbi:unnamed protein product [Mytilus coruscus]|uniref:Soluble interferon alpha/beta receptor OPG204 n=1 Tax=Mytilus coruscus TaxID=42192 RepID=A0A6J8EHS2_MYTCO|nr:unnamed protein product [Mytilus coruscus]
MDLENIYRWILAFSSFYGYATPVFIRGIIESTITLNCSLRGFSTEHSIIWKGHPNETNYSIQNKLYFKNIPKDLKPRLKIVGNFNQGFYNLQIKDLQFSDKGFYICHQFRSKHNEYFYLDVIGLNVTVSKPSYIGYIGSSITMGCNITSESSAISEVSWYFHSNGRYHRLEPLCNTGKYSKPTPENPSLTIEKLDLSDVGPYMCSATNGDGLNVNSTTTTLSLLKPKGLNVTVSKPSYVGEIGSSITLGCSITSESSNAIEVRWYFHSSGRYHRLEPTCNTGKYSIPTPENPSLTIEKLNLNDVGPYMCSATNGDGLNVNSTTTTLSLLDSKENRKVVFILGLICCLLVLLVVTELVLRKNKPMFFLQIAYTFQKAEDDDSKLWDAFISFKSQDVDHQFVSSKLYMKLETQLGYKLCIHHKDFLPGKAIANNIVDSIANSRRTILIISREYLQGGYTTFELEMAHAEMIATKSKHKIIPILLDKYDNLQGLMDDTLKHIIQSVTYITWPGETSQRDVKTFWKRLELSMPKRSRKLRITSDETTPLLKRVITTETVNGLVHSTITLNCSLHGGITWKGPPNESVYAWQNQLNRPRIPNNLFPRLKIIGNFSYGCYNLQIQNIMATDEGMYKCDIYKDSFDLFQLKVVGSINVRVAQSTYVGDIGGSITLGCIISSATSIVRHVRWYFYSKDSYQVVKYNEGKYSKPTTKNPSLIIHNLELSDVGPYICSATNTAGITANSTTPTNLTITDALKRHINLFVDSRGKRIAYISVLVCCLIVLLVVTALVLKKRKPIFLLKIAYKFQKVEDDDSKSWDAFVSFKSEEVDNRFVTEKLYVKLEKQRGFKLCIHHKDFLPGKAITNNIVDAIANSRRSILIISKEYLLGGYTTFEYEMAHAEMITSKSKHKIIPVLVDKFENLQGLMDDTMKCILKSVTYITWPGESNRKAVECFWDRLELSMPKKSKKASLGFTEMSKLLRSR